MDFILLSPIHFLIFIQLLLKFLGSRKENDVLIMNLPANFVLSCSTHLLYILFFFFFALDSFSAVGIPSQPHCLPASPIGGLLSHLWCIFFHSSLYNFYICTDLSRALFLPFKK